VDNQEKSPIPAVLFLVFNRPDTTKLVLEAIGQARPPRLYVACDGPRMERQGEGEAVQQVRALIQDLVDWPCEVHTLYRDKNLGCKRAVASALDWFFEHEEAGIVLEDDCLPHPDFWPYCRELLDRYALDERIFMISGNNFQDGRQVTQDSYYASALTHIWGWASWRRSWNKVDLDLPGYEQWVKMGGLERLFGSGRLVRAWLRTFARYQEGRYNTWDYPFLFAAWKHDQYALLPAVNLVTNIGFGHRGATHTAQDRFHGLSNLPTASLGFPLRHPDPLQHQRQADLRTLRNKMFPSYSLKAWRLFRAMLVHFLRLLGGLLGKKPVGKLFGLPSARL
jgi:hypothetical protein